MRTFINPLNAYKIIPWVLLKLFGNKFFIDHVNQGEKNLTAIRYYLKVGADVGAKDKHGNNTVLIATVHGYWNIFRELINNVRSKSPEQRLQILNAPANAKSKVTALNIAAYSGREAFAKEMLDSVTNEAKIELLTTQDAAGKTPYHVAKNRNQTPIITLFNGYDAPVPADLDLTPKTAFVPTLPKKPKRPRRPRHFIF